MNETTLLLAQIAGPTLVLLGLGLLLNKDFYADLYKKSMEPDLAYLLATMSMISIGAAIVTHHFLWGSLPEIIVSFLGLAILVKGAAFALLPKPFKNLVKSMISANLLMFGGLVWVIGGGYLCYIAFFA